MGVRLRLLTNHPEVITAADVSFHGFGPAQPASSADVTLRLWVHDVESQALPEPGFRAAGALVYRTAAHHSTLMADQERGIAWGYLSPSVIARPAYFSYHFLEFAFYVMLPSPRVDAYSRLSMRETGRALLIRAPSGGGKTTLVYAALRRGFQALAEDVVWIDAARQVWRGLPWRFRLPPDTQRFFPELGAYDPVLEINGVPRMEIEVVREWPGSAVVFAQPGPIVLLRRRPGRCSRLTSLDAAAAKALWFEAWSGSETDVASYHRYVNGLLRHGAYRLDFGEDLDQALDLLEPLLA